MARKKEPTLAEEAGLPESFHPVDSAPIIPSAPSVPPLNFKGQYFDGTLSPTMMQANATLVGTKYGYSTPVLPLMPLPSSGIPTVGSAIQSGSTTTITNSIVNAIASGPNGAVQFNNGGSLDGSMSFVFNSGTNTLTVGAGVDIT